jgi:hypothetical protein
MIERVYHEVPHVVRRLAGIPHAGITCNHGNRAVAQVVSHWPLTEEAGFSPVSDRVGFVVGKVVYGQVFV